MLEVMPVFRLLLLLPFNEGVGEWNLYPFNI